MHRQSRMFISPVLVYLKLMPMSIKSGVERREGLTKVRVFPFFLLVAQLALSDVDYVLILARR